MNAKTETFLEKYNYNNLFGIKYEASSFIPALYVSLFSAVATGSQGARFLREYLSVLTFGEPILANLEGIKSQNFPNHPTMAWSP